MNSGDVLDLERLETVRAIGRDPGRLLAELIALFLVEGAADLSRLQIASDANDFTDIGRLAHRLRGMSGNVGAARFGGACSRLEDVAAASHDSGASQGVADAVGEVRSEFSVAEAALRQFG